MINELFFEILAKYNIAKERPFTNNPLANVIRHDLPQAIMSSSGITEEYLMKGSAGQGTWAAIPWIGIFDKEITTSAQYGYDVVYLFNSKMRGFYLSLNQGWTQYEQEYGITNGQAEIRKTAVFCRQVLKSKQGFSTDPIDLAAVNTLGKGYEIGHICGKYYPLNKIPNDAILVNDLRNLLGVYRELKGYLGKDILNCAFLQHSTDENEEPNSLTTETIEVGSLLKHAVTDEEIQNELERLEAILKDKEPTQRRRLAVSISRNRKIVELVKKKAKYKCQICGYQEFEKRGGGYYAEAHHVEEISGGGFDLPSNLICVCPMCHKKIHYGKTLD